MAIGPIRKNEKKKKKKKKKNNLGLGEDELGDPLVSDSLTLPW
jgi:hypothetical protein